MLFKYKKYLTPTMRHRTYEVVSSNINYTKSKKLLSFKKRKSGRNFSGKITVRSRKSSFLYTVPFREYVDIGPSSYFFKEFVYSALTKHLSVSVKSSSGAYFLLPATSHTFLGLVYSPILNNNFFFKSMAVGLPTLLKNIPIFFKFSNLAPHSTTQLQYATSPGTYMIKVKASKKDKLLKTILPSKKTHFFKKTAYVIPGSNWDKTSKNFEPGKAGYFMIRGRRPTVRGVAKNPVDHPNGGRTKSCQPEKTPWGWVAKNNK